MTLEMPMNMTVMVYRGWWGVSYMPWWGLGEYRFGWRRIPCPYGGDGLVCDGAAKGLAMGDGVDFFGPRRWQDICRVGTRTDKVLADHVLELLERDGIDV